MPEPSTRPIIYDAAWTTAGVDPDKLHTALLKFDRNGRTHQKHLFMGELFIADYPADEQGRTFLEFFQTDRRRRRKGLVSVQLRTLP